MSDDAQFNAVKFFRKFADDARAAAAILREGGTATAGSGLQPEKLAEHYERVAVQADEHIRQIVGE